MNKRGQTGFEDIFYVLAYILAAGLIIFIVYYVYGEIKSPIDTGLNSAMPSGDTTFNVTSMLNNPTGGIGLLNNLFPLIVLGLIMMTVISAFYMGSHPIFFFVSLILLGVVIMLGAVYSNVYQQITTDTAFDNASTNINTTNLFMKYLPFEIGFIVVLFIIVLYANRGGQQGL